MLLSWFWPGGG